MHCSERAASERVLALREAVHFVDFAKETPYVRFRVFSAIKWRLESPMRATARLGRRLHTGLRARIQCVNPRPS